MFCEKCGNKLKNGDSFCEKCGEKIIAVESETGKPNKKKNKRKLIVLIIIIIILVVSVISGINNIEPEYDPDWSPETTESVDSKKIVKDSTEGKETTKISSDESNVIKVGNVEQLYESDEYEGKKIEITGVVNYEDPSTNTLIMYGAYSNVEALLIGASGYEVPCNDCLNVIGVVKKDEYGAVIISVEYAEELGETL